MVKSYRSDTIKIIYIYIYSTVHRYKDTGYLKKKIQQGKAEFKLKYSEIMGAEQKAAQITLKSLDIKLKSRRGGEKPGGCGVTNFGGFSHRPLIC